MGCSYGPVPIIPDINHKIRSSVFVGADAPLVVEVSSPSWAREHKIRVRQHLAYVRKIGAHLGMRWYPKTRQVAKRESSS